MRKGMEYDSQPTSSFGGKRNASGWGLEVLFPAVLVGASYLVATTFFGF